MVDKTKHPQDLEIRPAYAQMIVDGYEAKGWSQAELSRQANVDKAFLNRIIRGKDIPDKDVLYRLAKAMDFDEQRTETLERLAGEAFAERHPEEAARQEEWMKFQMVDAYLDFNERQQKKQPVTEDHPWHFWSRKLEHVVKYYNETYPKSRGGPMTPDRMMEILIDGRKNLFRSVIERANPVMPDHFTSPEKLAKALIAAVDLTLEEVSGRMDMGESHLHTVLNPKKRRTPTHAQSWSDLADALLLDRFGLKEAYMKAVVELRRSQLPPLRTVTQIVADLKTQAQYDGLPPVMDVLRILAQERTGDGWFLSRAEIERQAGIADRMLQNRKHAPDDDKPIIALCKTMEIPEDQEQQLKEIAAAERANGAPWMKRSNSWGKGESGRRNCP